MFRINPRVTREDGHRALLPEKAYVQRLIDRGQALRIGNVVVDAPQILQRRFACDTRSCVRAARSGRRLGSCCTDLEVTLTPGEIARLRRLARRYLRSPKAAAGSAERRIAQRVLTGQEWIERNERGESRLASRSNGVCSMGRMAADGRLHCALNAMTQAIGEPLPKWKLQTCFLFPLHYVEYEEGRFLLTVICEDNYQSLEADREIARLRCLRRPPATAPSVCQSLEAEITFLLGKRFYQRLRSAAQRLRRVAGNPAPETIPEASQRRS